MKVGRNQPCTCGSGAKYKKRHGRFARPIEAVVPPALAYALKRNQADRLIREQQQGLGRPIISAEVNGRRFVAVRNRLYQSTNWKTFPDFLFDYMKRVLDPAWGNAEIAKPFEQRHILMQWYDGLCRYLQTVIREPGVPHSGEMTGVAACYMGLAYSIYLLDHNVELQRRLVNRLKDPGNFQGAYYELMVANALIRAGFELTLEDEDDRGSRHCEFAAISKKTGKRYWVEAKMRAVSGLLGRTDKDGTREQNPTSHLIHHLSAALAKPADNERLIFIDLNADMPQVTDEKARPEFLEHAHRLLERYESRQLKEGMTAYVFVTNLAFHRRLDEPVSLAVAPFGLGMPDFNRPGYYRLADWYRNERKHGDAILIGDAFSGLLRLPSTFDGSLPSESLGKGASRILIGETYDFGTDDAPLIGTVTSASVNEAEKAMYFGITTHDGASQLRKQDLSDAELADYRRHPEAYFGQVQPVPRRADTPQEMFAFLMDAHREMPREKLLAYFAQWPNANSVQGMSDDDLLAEYCEAMVGTMQRMNLMPSSAPQPHEKRRST